MAPLAAAANLPAGWEASDRGLAGSVLEETPEWWPGGQS